MADTFFNEERVDELKEAYKLKAGDDEKLGVENLGPLLESIGLPPLSTNETLDMEAKADPENTGNVTFDNFLNLLKEKFAPPFTEDRLEKAFGVLRNPQNKQLHVDEIKHFLDAYNPECTKDLVDEFAKNIPLDGSNVDIDKFIAELLG